MKLEKKPPQVKIIYTNKLKTTTVNESILAVLKDIQNAK